MIESTCFFCLVYADTSLDKILLYFFLSYFQDGTKVYGRCGGFCGKCVPHMTTGLPIQVIWKCRSGKHVPKRSYSLGSSNNRCSFLQSSLPEVSMSNTSVPFFFRVLIRELSHCLIFTRPSELNLDVWL